MIDDDGDLRPHDEVAMQRRILRSMASRATRIRPVSGLAIPRGLIAAVVALASSCSSAGPSPGSGSEVDTWLVGYTVNQQNDGCGSGSFYTIVDVLASGGALGDAVLDSSQFCLSSFDTDSPSYGAIAGNAVGFTLALQNDQSDRSGGSVSFNIAGDAGSHSVGSFGSPVISVTAPLADGTFFAGEASSGHLDICNINDGGDQSCPIAVEFPSVSVNVLTLDPKYGLLWVGLDDGGLYKCALASNPLVCTLVATANSSITAIAVEPASGDLAFSIYETAGSSGTAGVTMLPDAGGGAGGSFTLPAGGASPSDSGPFTALEFANGSLYVLEPDGDLLAYPPNPGPSSPATSLGTFSNDAFDPTYGKAAVTLASDGTNVFVVGGANGTELLVCENGQAPCVQQIDIGEAPVTSAYFQTIGAVEPFVIDP